MTASSQMPLLSSEAFSRLARDPRFARAMERFYRELDAAVAGFAPACWNRGLCCRFDRAGHRLFVTSLELLYFAARVADGGGELLEVEAPAGRCPYQIGGACTARQVRPLGCRVYFCQASAAWWQPGASERWLARLKQMHAEFGVPYAYVEWLIGLRAVRSLVAGARGAPAAAEDSK